MNMEEMSLPLHSWFWLIVPMFSVFLLSILNYIMSRSRKSESSRTGIRKDSDGNEPVSG